MPALRLGYKQNEKGFATFTLMRGVFLFLFVILFGQGYGQIKFANLQAAGLTCALCSRTVQKSLEKVSFVKSIKPNIETGEYLLTFKDDAAINFDEVRKAVESAGFSVGRLAVTAFFQNQKIEKDKAVEVGDLQFLFLNNENKLLQGEQTFTLVEKNFLSPKTWKKYCSNLQRACDAKELSGKNARVYKVVL